MQLNRGMRIDAAKAEVAKKLGVAVADLADPVAMGEVRSDLNLGCVAEGSGVADGIAAKCRIAEVLGLEINSVNRFKELSGLS